MTAERCSVHFRFSGPMLDVEPLVARARPTGVHETWKRGEPLPGGRQATTSGVQIEIGDFEDVGEAVDAIGAFVDAETAFLDAVGSTSTGETLAAIAVALWIYGDQPVEVSFDPDLLARLARAGITIEVTGFPRESD